MIQKSNKEKILGLFFNYPTKPYQLREISKLTKIGLPSVKRYTQLLMGEGLIKKEKGQVFPYFIANRESTLFKILKVANMRLRIEESGLLEDIEKIYPDCIVLFGSSAHGEDTEKSDVDIFVQAKEGKIHTAKFEKFLKRKVAILFEPEIRKLQKELINNLANGIVLSGYLKVV